MFSLLCKSHNIFWAKENAWDSNGWYVDSFMEGGYTEVLNLVVDGGNYFSLNGTANDYFPLNEWTHIVWTFNTTDNNASLYINGINQTLDINGNPSSISQVNDEKCFGIVNEH